MEDYTLSEDKKRDKSEYDLTYYEKNKELIKEKRRIYYEENKERVLEKHRQYNKANPEKRRNLTAKYRRENPEKCKRDARDYHAKRARIDPDYKLLGNLRCRLYSAVCAQGTKKSSETMALIGCTPSELKSHLEDQFTEGMAWENYGEWHVDHIRPCASFDLSIDKEQEICFNYTNLQPLWAVDNLKKGDTYHNDKP